MNLITKLQNIIKKDKRSIGQMGEDAAAKHLKNIGMRILHSNWRHGQLEIDLICQDGDTIVFVEVKTRNSKGLTSPIEGVNQHKKNALLRAAKTWLTVNNAWEKPCRFDVVGVLYDAQDSKPNFHVEYYDNAFDLSAIMGSGNSSWQPW